MPTTVYVKPFSRIARPITSRVAAEACLPQPVADDRFVFRTEQPGVNGEAATDCGLNSEDVEQVFRCLDRRNSNGITGFVGEIELWTPPRRRVGEDGRERAVVVERHGRNGLVLQPLFPIRIPDRDQSAWIAIGQRPEHDAFQKAEHAGGRADAESERKDGGDGEARAACEASQGKADVTDQRVHGSRKEERPHPWTWSGSGWFAVPGLWMPDRRTATLLIEGPSTGRSRSLA